MINAKEELLNHLTSLNEKKGKAISIKCASIKCERSSYWADDNQYVGAPPIKLKEGYTPTEYEKFLEKLNFEYDNGYGSQELSGTIWLSEDNTWYERGEYDGSEWWAYRECPQVPNELKA